MAKLLPVPTFLDARGALAAVDGLLPFPIRRVFAITRVPAGATRGGHRHRSNRQALLCLTGRCTVEVRRGGVGRDYELDSPAVALLLEPEDWHLIRGLDPGSVLLALASEPYDPADYLAEPLP